jgi:dihydrofolate reductase
VRRLIVTEFVSLDGVMEAPGDEPGYAHSGWVGRFFSDELGAYKQAEQLATDILVLGRTTYESFYGAWPNREGPFADKINTMPKYVASTTLHTLEWETASLLDGPVTDAVARLKQQEGGPILVPGSRTLVHTLLEAGLVDQLNLQVFPLLLGSGMRLYPETAGTTTLRLVSSEALASGVLLQTYEPALA